MKERSNNAPESLINRQEFNAQMARFNLRSAPIEIQDATNAAIKLKTTSLRVNLTNLN